MYMGIQHRDRPPKKLGWHRPSPFDWLHGADEEPIRDCPGARDSRDEREGPEKVSAAIYHGVASRRDRAQRQTHRTVLGPEVTMLCLVRVGRANRNGRE